MDAWNLLGGYELQRLGVVDIIDPIADPEALVLCLTTIRDTLQSNGGDRP
jgi:hypothetical protein